MGRTLISSRSEASPCGHSEGRGQRVGAGQWEGFKHFKAWSLGLGSRLGLALKPRPDRCGGLKSGIGIGLPV